jgi:hypothetical protein
LKNAGQIIMGGFEPDRCFGRPYLFTHQWLQPDREKQIKPQLKYMPGPTGEQTALAVRQLLFNGRITGSNSPMALFYNL